MLAVPHSVPDLRVSFQEDTIADSTGLDSLSQTTFPLSYVQYRKILPSTN